MSYTGLGFIDALISNIFFTSLFSITITERNGASIKSPVLDIVFSVVGQLILDLCIEFSNAHLCTRNVKAAKA